MKAQERDETIKVFEDLIKYLEDNLIHPVFLCIALGKDGDLTKSIDGGYNQRMLPNARAYLISQRPTSRRNKEHYNAVTYIKEPDVMAWWDIWTQGFVAANMDKIRFIKHLIQKLKR
jgi:hypothetical protein